MTDKLIIIIRRINGIAHEMIKILDEEEDLKGMFFADEVEIQDERKIKNINR